MARQRSNSLPPPPRPIMPRRHSINELMLGSDKQLVFNDHTIDNIKQLCDPQGQITVDCVQDQFLQLETESGWRYYISGSYALSTVLNEFVFQRGGSQTYLERLKQYEGEHSLNGSRSYISRDTILEPPSNRLKTLIDTRFWPQLTRSMDANTLSCMLSDTKVKGEGALYLPHGSEQQKYYGKRKYKVRELPKKITPEYVLSINSEPGVLSLAMDKNNKPLPYIVPGGRFNEMYGWDSYFELLGLLESGGSENLFIAESMCRHFCYQIQNYGKVLNANRTYYLSRSQPPFLTDMGLRVYRHTRNADFLKEIYDSAVYEYRNVWMSAPRLDEMTGLSKYCPTGVGVPPEVESGHFDLVLEPYANKYGCSIEEFIILYNSGKVKEPDLDDYFLHDRAIRESGHDTSYRLEGVCADLATVDLNSLLYKYEVDLEYIEEELGLPFSGFAEAANRRKVSFEKYLWNADDSCFYDYNCKSHQQRKYTSSTGLWPLWAGIATHEQAEGAVATIQSLEEVGGLASGSQASLFEFSGGSKIPRQWDFPNGWAPHQILAWQGLENYGYSTIASRLAFKWCSMMTHSFKDYSGIVVEKYNVADPKKPHVVTAEYGNQGSVYSGFGWVNASYVVGLTYLKDEDKRRLGWGTWNRNFIK